MDMALSDTTGRQAPAKGKGKDYTLNDFDGLALFVSAKGSKHWYFRFCWDGKQQRISLGRYPEIGLRDLVVDGDLNPRDSGERRGLTAAAPVMDFG
jgi:hypothetical protein